jgi:hypothetical protein
MRFSIRDLLWLTLAVAMGLGWWVSYRDYCELEYDRKSCEVEIAKLRDEVQRLKLIVMYQGVPPRDAKVSILTLDGQ